MSKISIAGATTGTGTFTLASPATNVDRVLTLPDEAGTVLTTAGVPASAMPAGSVIQVVSNFITAAFSTTATSPTNVTGFNVTITPSSTNNKILLLAVLHGNNTATGFFTQYTRNGTVLTVGDTTPQVANGLTYEAGGSTQESTTYMLLDSPSSTSALTYQGQVWGAGSGTTYINRSPNGTGSGGAVSTITVMEIAG